MLKTNNLSSLSSRIQKRLLLELSTLIQPVVEVEGVKIFTDFNLSNRMRSVLRGTAVNEEKNPIKYEELEMELVRTQLSPNDVVMEIGAGIGLLSTYCAKIVGSERVFAYEANPAMERYIRNAYKLNNVSPTLEICMLGEHPGEKTFYIEKEFWISSTIQRSSKAKAVTIPAKSFNQEVQRIKPTFLIIDIEGGEYDLIQYADFSNIQKIVMEVHEDLLGKNKIDFLKSKIIKAGLELNQTWSRGNVLFFQRN